MSRVLRSALAHVALLPAAGAATRCHGPRLLSQGRQEQRSAPTSEAVAPEPKPVTSYQPSAPALQPRAAARSPSRHSCPPLCRAAPASCLQTLPCLVLANCLPNSPRRSHADAAAVADASAPAAALLASASIACVPVGSWPRGRAQAGGATLAVPSVTAKMLVGIKYPGW